MTDAEIALDYKLAKYKYKQISILADLNAVGRKTIIDILIRQGVYEEPKKKKGARR